MSQRYLLVNSDNFDNVVMTEEAYMALRLTMSSGDFGSHRAKYVKPGAKTKVLDVEDINGEF